MKIHVDRDFCQLHGNCVAAAPSLFWFNDEGELEYKEYASEKQGALARDAEAGCPMSAIEVSDEQRST